MVYTFFMIQQHIHHIRISVGELWLKGKNQTSFVDRLLYNIRAQVLRSGGEISTLSHAQGIITLRYQGDQSLVIDALAHIPGIATFTFVQSLKRDMQHLTQAVEEIFTAWALDGVTLVRFDTRRRDKRFALTSPEINATLGAIASQKGLKCDYKHAEHTIKIVVDHEEIFISQKRYRGMGGLPVGSSGKGLVLLSGGIDSPVSAVRMMRRGVAVDYIHFHTFAHNSDVLKTKMPEIIKRLNRFAPRGAKLYLVPYTFFDLAVQERVPARLQVIFFKNFMHQCAAQIAGEKNYQMLINGDALAQVASQTPENMRAAMHGVDALLLRPLVGMCKEEIISLSRAYDLYEESIKPYKDCCSLVAKNPATRINNENYIATYRDFPMQEIITQTSKHLDVFDIE